MTRGARIIVALLTGALAGIAVMVAVNVPVYHFGNWPDQPSEYFGFWGVLFGAFTAPFAFGMALALFRREIAPRRAARRQPTIWSLLAAGVVGIALMAAVNVPIYNSGQWPDHGREILGFWGTLFGLVASLATFFVVYRKLRREEDPPDDLAEIEPPRNKVGLLISAIVSALFGLLVTSWNVMWGTPLTSLEGAWLWPLAIIPLLTSGLLFRAYRRSRGSEKP